MRYDKKLETIMNSLSNRVSIEWVAQKHEGGKRYRMTCIVCILLVVISLTACASFPAYQTPKVGTLSVEHTWVSDKPSVYIPLKFLVDLSDGQNPGMEMTAPLPELKQVVKRTAQEADLFHDFTFESFQAGNADYVLQIAITDSGDIRKAMGAGIITGASVFLIPSAATDNYNVTANLYDADGQLLKSYSYDDKVTTWFGIWFLPMASHTPKEASMGVCENMIRRLFRDLSEDGLLSISTSQEQSSHLGEPNF